MSNKVWCGLMFESFDVLQWKDLWDKATQSVIEERLTARPVQNFFNDNEVEALEKLVEAILPGIDKSIPVVEILGQDLQTNQKKGVRQVDLPWKPKMYTQGLASLDEESKSIFGKNVSDLNNEQLSELLERVSSNHVGTDTWKFPAYLFFQEIVSDIVTIYYSFPQGWSEIRFTGPVYPQGYYQLGCDEKMKFEPDL